MTILVRSTSIRPQIELEPSLRSQTAAVFAIAVIVATAAICPVVAAPSTVALILASRAVIGFAAGIVALLSRLIGPEDH